MRCDSCVPFAHGESTCAWEPGHWCRFLYFRHMGQTPWCHLYEMTLAGDDRVLRCEACVRVYPAPRPSRRGAHLAALNARRAAEARAASYAAAAALALLMPVGRSLTRRECTALSGSGYRATARALEELVASGVLTYRDGAYSRRKCPGPQGG